MRFHQRPGDGQPQARLRLLLVSGRVHPVKTLEDVRQVFGVDARGGIRNGQGNLPVLLARKPGWPPTNRRPVSSFLAVFRPTKELRIAAATRC